MTEVVYSRSRMIALGEAETNERAALAVLDQLLDPSWIIFHSRKPLQGRPDIDVLIVAQEGAFVAELKYYRDAIHISSGAQWQRQMSDGSSQSIPNILQGQVTKQAQKLKAEFKAVAGLHHVWIEPVVIFTHEESKLYFGSTDGAALAQVVFALPEAKTRLEQLAAQNRQKARRLLTRVDVEKIAASFDVAALLPTTDGWSEAASTSPSPIRVKSADQLLREQRRRANKWKAILTLIGALLVTVAIYAVVMDK